MKNKLLIKTLAVFLSTTALLQVSGISSKLVNGSDVVQASANEKKYQVISSISIEGDLVEGQILKVVVKNKDGEDITESVDPYWYAFDNPITENYQYLSANDNKYKYSSKYLGIQGNTYKLEKEDVGKYIGIEVLGEDPSGHTNFGSVDIVTTLKSTSTKVVSNPLMHWQKEDEDYKGYKSTYWYYLNNDGSKVKGWKQIGGYWYYFSPKSGKLQTGWENINGKWYYFMHGLNGKGKMLTNGWVNDVVIQKGQKNQIKYYYLYSDGTMASNTTIDGHYLDASGATMDTIDKSLVKS